MKKVLVNVLCCVVPSRRGRRNIRQWATQRRPQNNLIEIVKEDGRRVRVRRVRGCTFVFTGDNNHVVLHEPLGKLTLNVNVSSGVYIELYPSIQWQRKIKVNKQYGQMEKNRLVVGRHLKTTDFVSIDFCHGGGDVVIGEDCMFATGINIRTGDFHALVDSGSGIVKNFNRDVYIGNHVWVATNAMIMKGAYIADNSVIGACSLVNKQFKQSNVVVAGVPARVVKENITWDVRSPYQYAVDMGQV